MTDPDNLAVCSGCLHGVEQHGVTGCLATDNLGNRCACEVTS